MRRTPEAEGSSAETRERHQLHLRAVRDLWLETEECFYRTTAHATQLRASSRLNRSEVDLAAVNGGADSDCAVAHGTARRRPDRLTRRSRFGETP